MGTRAGWHRGETKTKMEKNVETTQLYSENWADRRERAGHMADCHTAYIFLLLLFCYDFCIYEFTSRTALELRPRYPFGCGGFCAIKISETRIGGKRICDSLLRA